MPETTPNLDTLPEDLADNVVQFLRPGDVVNLSLVSKSTNTLFARPLLGQKLLHAIFIWNEELVLKIVNANPSSLLIKGTYRMPLNNPDGTSSDSSEQIYYDVTPLQLLVFSGNFNMWHRVFTLIIQHDSMSAEEKQILMNAIFATLESVKHGGPDLIKIDFDPREAIRTDPLFWENIKHYSNVFDENTRANYDLLHNVDGIICYNNGHHNLYFYANSETQTLEQVYSKTHVDDTISEQDLDEFAQFQNSIAHGLASNSSRRSSDAEHALIQKIFGKKLQRNGIHYELKGNCYGEGVHYHDTYFGCHRLINDYLRYLELYYVYRDLGRWDEKERAWRHFVGLAQRYSMPCIIQHYILQDIENADLRLANLTLNMNNDSHEKLYPHTIGRGCGIGYALCKDNTGMVYQEHGAAAGDGIVIPDLLAFARLSETIKNEAREWQQILQNPEAYYITWMRDYNL